MPKFVRPLDRNLGEPFCVWQDYTKIEMMLSPLCPINLRHRPYHIYVIIYYKYTGTYRKKHIKRHIGLLWGHTWRPVLRLQLCVMCKDRQFIRSFRLIQPGRLQWCQYCCGCATRGWQTVVLFFFSAEHLKFCPGNLCGGLLCQWISAICSPFHRLSHIIKKNQ